MKVDTRKLDELVDQKLLRKNKHPEFPLWIYNYTEKVQYERLWTPETRMCRGLIVDEDGNIHSRPFEKFFNLGEIRDWTVPDEPFDVTEKMDGSLGISYEWEGKWYIATRGSFTSDQALAGCAILAERYPYVSLLPGVTYLFEIIHPSSRVVVDYGDREDLVMLAAIDAKSGEEFPLRHSNPGFPEPRHYSPETINHLYQMEEDNMEGWVVRWKSGVRVKMKTAEYVRLHRLVTGINERHVWDILRTNGGIESILDAVPDDYAGWAEEVANNLINSYEEIEATAKKEAKTWADFSGRKEAAAYIKAQTYPGILFAMLDDKPYEEMIWKMIRPERPRTFRYVSPAVA